MTIELVIRGGICVGRNQQELKNYMFSAAVIIGRDIYFFSERENILMKIDMNNWKLEYSNIFMEYTSYHESRPDVLRVIDEKIFKLSLDGQYIEEFSINNGLYKKINIGKYEKPWGNFVACEVLNQYIYIFSKWKKEVIKINVIDYQKDIIRFSEDEEFDCFTAACRTGNSIWLFESKSRLAREYNMEKNTLSSFMLPDEIEECVFACWKENAFYLLTSNNYVYIWNPYTKFRKIVWRGERYNDIENCFEKSIIIQQKLYLLPCLGSDIVIVDIESGEEQIYKEYPEDFSYCNKGWSKYTDYFEDDGYVYYPMRTSNYIMTIHKKSGEIIWNRIIPPQKEEKIKFYFNKSMIHQDDLNVFMNCFEVDGRKGNQRVMKIGENTWETIKK